MRTINWKVVEIEEDSVIVEFEVDSIVINKLSFVWRGDESALIKEIDNYSLYLLREIELKEVITEPTGRKLLALKGSKNSNDVLSEITITSNTTFTIDYL